jgi:hypothetical protein
VIEAREGALQTACALQQRCHFKFLYGEKQLCAGTDSEQQHSRKFLLATVLNQN